MLMDPRVVDAWLEHPLVREAHHGLRDDASILDLFENLRRVLDEVEDQFPGVPFRTILSAYETPDPERVRKTMRQAGVPEKNINLAIGFPEEDFVGKIPKRVMQLLWVDAPKQVWFAEGFTKAAWRLWRRLAKPLSEIERRAVQKVMDGLEIHGHERRTARAGFRKLAYQKWAAEQRP